MSVTSITRVVAFFVLLAIVTSCRPPSNRVNGCSPSWLSYPGKYFFTAQCNIHDVCYACVSFFRDYDYNFACSVVVELSTVCRSDAFVSLNCSASEPQTVLNLRQKHAHTKIYYLNKTVIFLFILSQSDKMP